MDELWEQVWGELRAGLGRQPLCAEHPEFPCVRTLGQGAVNDILRVDEDGVRVRSHRTGNEDVIPAAAFRTETRRSTRTIRTARAPIGLS